MQYVNNSLICSSDNLAAYENLCHKNIFLSQLLYCILPVFYILNCRSLPPSSPQFQPEPHSPLTLATDGMATQRKTRPQYCEKPSTLRPRCETRAWCTNSSVDLFFHFPPFAHPDTAFIQQSLAYTAIPGVEWYHFHTYPVSTFLVEEWLLSRCHRICLLCPVDSHAVVNALPFLQIIIKSTLIFDIL